MNIRLILAVMFLACCIGAPAQAHRPYLSHKTLWVCAEGKVCSLAVLNGDGILFEDPMRPVILNQDGKVIAIGPLNQNPFPVCFSAKDCRFVSDDGVLAPDPATFGNPRVPDFYPEHLDRHRKDNGVWKLEYEFPSYGLKPTSISPMQRLWFWKTVVASSPPLSVALLLSGALLGWRISRPGTERPKLNALIGPSVASAVFVGLIVLGGPRYYAGVAIALFLGASIAALAARKLMSLAFAVRSASTS